MLRFAVMVLSFITVVCLAGCSSSKVPVVQAQVTITVDEVPIPVGNITLRSESGGETVFGEIIDGKASIRGTKQLSGRYKAEIRGYRKTGKKVASMADPSGEEDELVSIVPEKFNTKSNFFVEFPLNPPKIELQK